MSWPLAFCYQIDSLSPTRILCFLLGRGFDPCRLISQLCFWPVGGTGRRWESAAAVFALGGSSLCKMRPLLWFQLLLQFWPLGAITPPLPFVPPARSGVATCCG